MLPSLVSRYSRYCNWDLGLVKVQNEILGMRELSQRLEILSTVARANLVNVIYTFPWVRLLFWNVEKEVSIWPCNQARSLATMKV